MFVKIILYTNRERHVIFYVRFLKNIRKYFHRSREPLFKYKNIYISYLTYKISCMALIQTLLNIIILLKVLILR